MLDSVRTRLTLWYVAVLLLVLMAFSFGVYELLARNLQRRTEIGLHAALESMHHLLTYERAEGDSEQEAARNTVMELRYPNMALAVYTGEGRLLAETLAADNKPARLPLSPTLINEEIRYFTLPDSQEPNEDGWRVAVRRVRALPTDAPTLIVARQSLEPVTEELELLRQVFLLAIPLTIALAGLGGWFLARKALAPVVSMSESARRIGAHNLNARLPVANARDELGQMAETFNELLARLNAAFDQQRQFMADASHELRIPISILHTTAQVTLEQPQREEPEYRESLTLIDAQTRRLARIVEDMFTLARADAGQRPRELTGFYLDELVADTVRAAQVLGGRNGVTVVLSSTHETPFCGDEGLLRQLLLNLLDNAVKYTPPAGAVSVTLLSHVGSVEIAITHTGRGIPPEAQPRIFERFTA
jgi:signal transduction histidine kinase